MSITTKNSALKQMLDLHLSNLSKNENLDSEFIINSINNGTMVLLGNINHKNVKPILIGQPAKIKVNANIGTSPFICSIEDELKKLEMVEFVGADTYMDLSIDGDLDNIRTSMIGKSSLPIGTVPIYAAAKKNSEKGKKAEDLDMNLVFDEIEMQAEQGVDYMTIHTGIDMKSVEFAEKNRILGVVSRGGSMIARWMRINKKDNPFMEHFDRILKIAKKYNVTLSLGDGMRPGALADSGDYAQMQEVLNLGLQVKAAREYGVQAMVEGPGHVPLNSVYSQIKSIKEATFNAPLYILGPLVVDNGAGYDHISGAIGASIAVTAGADFLCYLTPAEHLTLPNMEDVRQGIMASKIAAMAGDNALGREYAVKAQQNMSIARMNLDWNGMKKYALDGDMVEKRRYNHSDKEECAMCGDFCSVKLRTEKMDLDKII